MDQLRDGIWTVGYGERNPLVEYKLRGFRVFQETLMIIKREMVEFLMKVQFRDTEVPREEPKSFEPQGQEVKQELDQFGNPASGPGKVVTKRQPKEAEAVIGGSKRKKTRRSRRG
jgi:preprotein translocase subunit SecA